MSDAPRHALLLEQVHPDAVETLRSSGFDIETMDRSLDEQELLDTIDGVELLGVRSNTKVTRRVLDAATSLIAVGAFSIGTTQIDLAAATANGVVVFNAPFSNTRSVVELAIAEIIAMTRRLTEKNALMHRGIWDKSADGAHEVRGRTLGIVGYGNIGVQVSVLAENLGMHVRFYDKLEKLAIGSAQQCASLPELLGVSDVVTLHVDDSPDNANFFGAAQFAAMKPGALFLNLSRGFVVDYQALRGHLQSGHIGGAAVDVYPVEPRRRGDEFTSELRGLSNVILTPHIGGSTEEAQQDIGRFVAGKLRAFALDGATTMSVNVPGVALPRTPDTVRLAHVHRNVPGVLARVNGLLADGGVNVEAQSLMTHADLGYAVTDIAGGELGTLLSKIEAMPETLRLRVID